MPDKPDEQPEVRPPKLDFSKGYRYPPGPGDPTWEAMTWFDKYVLDKGRPLTEDDLELLRRPRYKGIKP